MNIHNSLIRPDNLERMCSVTAVFLHSSLNQLKLNAHTFRKGQDFCLEKKNQQHFPPEIEYTF